MFKKREKKLNEISVLNKKEEGIKLENSKNSTNYRDFTYISGNNLLVSDINFLKKKRLNTFSNTNQFSTKKDSQEIANITDELKYKSDYLLQNVNMATRELEVDTERDRDATAIRERNEKISQDKLEGKIDSSQYLGQSATIIYAEKSEKDKSRAKITGSFGPMRAPTNIRTTCRFDYAHGICKDYKETGYCGFGDNCIFAHDRSDYKTGWEVEEEWRREQFKKQKRVQDSMCSSEKNINDDECDSSCESVKYDSDEEKNESYKKIPMKCAICSSDYVSPIITKCFHCFCESCAIKYYGKSSLCFTCKKPTNGIFNNADSIIQLIINKRKKGKKNKSSVKAKNLQNKVLDSDTMTNITSEELENMDYLNRDDRKYQNTFNFDGEDEEKNYYGFKDYKSNKGKNKNKFKTQNDLEFISDYKSY
jgi:RING finger protein 113A